LSHRYSYVAIDVLLLADIVASVRAALTQFLAAPETAPEGTSNVGSSNAAEGAREIAVSELTHAGERPSKGTRGTVVVTVSTRAFFLPYLSEAVIIRIKH
jgi:hypothetical protein